MQFQLNISMVAGGNTVSQSINSTSVGGRASIVAETIPLANDTLMAISFPYATIKACVLRSTVDCTIETNSGSAPDDTITLEANCPKVYLTNSTETFGTSLFTADVTAFYVTAATAGVLDVEVLYDVTA